jgi:hypothetical protein
MADHGVLAGEGKEGEERGRGHGLLAVGRREAPLGGSCTKMGARSLLFGQAHCRCCSWGRREGEEREKEKKKRKDRKKEKKKIRIFPKIPRSKIKDNLWSWSKIF